MTWLPSYTERKTQPLCELIPIDGQFNIQVDENVSSLQVKNSRYHMDLFNEFDECIKSNCSIKLKRLSNGLVYIERI